jgi:hypothetical protein
VTTPRVGLIHDRAVPGALFDDLRSAVG